LADDHVLSGVYQFKSASVKFASLCFSKSIFNQHPRKSIEISYPKEFVKISFHGPRVFDFESPNIVAKLHTGGGCLNGAELYLKGEFNLNNTVVKGRVFTTTDTKIDTPIELKTKTDNCIVIPKIQKDSILELVLPLTGVFEKVFFQSTLSFSESGLKLCSSTQSVNLMSICKYDYQMYFDKTFFTILLDFDFFETLNIKSIVFLESEEFTSQVLFSSENTIAVAGQRRRVAYRIIPKSSCLNVSKVNLSLKFTSYRERKP
jgi:hypothetical protein